MYLYPMAGWPAGVTAIFVRALAPVNGTCLGYGALVNSTNPVRGNVIAKTRTFCLRLPVHGVFVVTIKANMMHHKIKLNGLKKMSVIVDITQTIHHFTVPKWVDIVRNDLSR